MGIVDQTFPADGGARLLEIDAHDDAEVVLQPICLGFQECRIFESGVRVMDRARPDDGEQAVVLAIEDGIRLGACGVDDGSDVLGCR